MGSELGPNREANWVRLGSDWIGTHRDHGRILHLPRVGVVLEALANRDPLTDVRRQPRVVRAAITEVTDSNSALLLLVHFLEGLSSRIELEMGLNWG